MEVTRPPNSSEDQDLRELSWSSGQHEEFDLTCQALRIKKDPNAATKSRGIIPTTEVVGLPLTANPGITSLGTQKIKELW